VAHPERLLLLALRLGLVIAVLGVGLAAWLAVRRLLHGAPVGAWSVVLAAATLLGGLHLGLLALVGLQVAAVVAAVRGRPLYVVGERV
jgi:hypothetical protein